MGRHAGPPLTQAQVDRMKPGQMLWDGAVPGLGIRCGVNSKTWRVKVPLGNAGVRRIAKDGSSRTAKFKVESFPYTGAPSLTDARKRAIEIKGAIFKELGDPEALRRRARANEITLEQAWNAYVLKCKNGRSTRNGYQRKKPCSARYVQELEDTLRLSYGDWKHRTLADLAADRDAFEVLFDDITENRGPTTADKAIRIFRTVWGETKTKFPELPDCPANVISDLNGTKEREDAYTPEELPGVVDAIWRAGRFRAGLHFFLMLSGFRSGGVKKALRSNYDREAGTLLIPEHKGNEDTVYLSPVMISLLDAMIELGDRYFPGHPYIFCGHSASGCLTDHRIKAPPSAATAKRRAEDGLQVDGPIGSHIWRHTWISLYPLAGLTRYDGAKMVGHKLGGAEGNSAHAGYGMAIPSHLREQQAKMSDYLMTAAGLGADYRFGAGCFGTIREISGLI